MKIRIRNYIGVAQAELEIHNGITLIAGDNAVGKSSVLRGIGSLLTGDILPRGINKGDSDAVVMDGSKAAELILTTDKDSAAIAYPNPKYITMGDPPHASAIAVGLANYTDMKQEERARFLAQLLQAAPKEEAVAAALAEHMTQEDIHIVLRMVEKEGFDGTVERLKERRVKLKGKWEDMTGQRWGDNKAVQWLPEGWSEYDEIAVEQVSARLAASQEAYDRAAKKSVVDETEYQGLVDLLGRREPTQMALSMAKTQLPTIEAAWSKLHAEMEGLPKPIEEGVPCPHCGAFVVMRYDQLKGTYSIVPAEKMEEGEPERRKQAIAAKREEVKEAYKKLEYQQHLIGECEAKLREIQKAETKLKGSKKGDGHDEIVQKALAQLEKAKASAARVKLANDADETAGHVRLQSIVIEILGPEGLRRRSLNAKLSEFESTQLAMLVKTAPTWKAVTIDRETLLPRYGGRPYVLCSRSEQWRTNVLLQIAIALLEGAAMVCIDGADILSVNGQDDFFMSVLEKLPFPVVVGAMYSRPKGVPDLARAELGLSYWMKDGALSVMAFQ